MNRLGGEIMELAVPLGSVMIAVLTVIVGPAITRWLGRRAQDANTDKARAESDSVNAEARRTDVSTLRDVMAGIMLDLERTRNDNQTLYLRIEQLEKKAIETTTLYQSKISDMQSLITSQQLHIQEQSGEISRLRSHVERLERIATANGTLS